MSIGRNGLETQAKVLIASVMRPYIPFTLEPRNFTLTLFQDYLRILNSNVYETMDF